LSYCRFMEADVYVFMDVGGFLNCCACNITDDEDQWGSFHAFSTVEMIDHLNTHRMLGQHVPESVFKNIEKDDQENFGGKA
jgi:hypothetical protein